MGAIPLSEGFATRVLAVLALPAAALTARRWTSSQQQRSRGVAEGACAHTHVRGGAIGRLTKKYYNKVLSQKIRGCCMFQ